MIFNKPLEKYDFILQSEDKKSNIVFPFVDVELERSKSINYLVHIKDDQFAGQVDIWIDQEEFNRFVKELLKAENREIENMSLKAVSEEELEVTFIDQRMGRYEIEFLSQLKEKLKDINKLLL